MQIAPGLRLHQHAHGADRLESIPVPDKPLPGSIIGTDEKERTGERLVVRPSLHRPGAQTGGANRQQRANVGGAEPGTIRRSNLR